MGYLTEGHPRNDQALTQSLHVPASENENSTLEHLDTWKAISRLDS
jgi:hypothetical protein